MNTGVAPALAQNVESSRDAAPMKSRLVFDHLPKTAGTSISAALEAMFGLSGALPAVSNQHSGVMATAGDRRVLAGHLWFHRDESLDPAWYYCTVLRDPVDRFLSQYWFNRAIARGEAEGVSGAQLADPHVAAAAAYDLGAYLAAPDPSLRRSYSNVQAAHFAQRVHDDPWSLPEPEFLDAAVAALEPYDLVGVYDDIQGFLDIISVDLAVPRAELGKLNITPARRHRDETPAALVAALREVNWVDLRLCEIAWQRFEQAVARAASAPRRVAAPIASPQARPEPAPMREDFGTRELEVLAVRCIGTHTDVSHVPSGEALKVVLECHAWQPVGEFTIGLAVHDRQGQLVYGSNSRLLNMALSATQSGRFEQAFLLDTRLGPGEYFVTATLHRGASHTDGCFHWVRNAASFSIVAFPAAPFEGLLDLRLAADMPGMQRFPAMLDDYRARLQLAGAPARLTAGSLATFEVEAHNAGTQAWLTAGERPIRLSYHWHAEDGSMQVYDGERSELPFDVLPGRSARIRAAVRAPDVPGTYQIRFSLVQEGVAWFDERGTPSADAWIAVE